MRKAIPYEKKYIVQRVAEIIRDYLYDEDESYATIEMYFEKSNGENQHKVLSFGKTSKITPDEFRSEPYGFNDVPTEYCDDGVTPAFNPRSGNEIFSKEIVWILNGKPWDGTTLSELRSKDI